MSHVLPGGFMMCKQDQLCRAPVIPLDLEDSDRKEVVDPG